MLGMDDAGVSAVLGAVLMMSLTVMMVPSAILLKNALVEEMDAHREAAERAAYCARHPEVGKPTCLDRAPLAGYRCEPVGRAFVCHPADGALENATNTTDAWPPPLKHNETMPT